MSLKSKLEALSQKKKLEWLLAAKDEEKAAKLRRMYFTKVSIGSATVGVSSLLFYHSSNPINPTGLAASLFLATLGVYYAYHNMKDYLYWRKLEKL